MSNYIKAPKEEIELCRIIADRIIQVMKKYHPGLKRFDSNVVHFIAYRFITDNKWPISTGWFKHGPYVLAMDDALIEMGIMDKSQHQLNGNEKMMENLIECDCHV